MHLADHNASERVQSIELRDLHRSLPDFEDDFDFNQLEYLRCPNLQSLNVAGRGTALFVDVFDMLSCHPGIKELCLKNLWWSWGDMDARETPVSMPKLRDFKISHTQHSCFIKTFEMLRLPALERISVEKTYAEFNSIPTMGPIRIQQTFPLVKEVVAAGSLATIDIAYLLQKTPSAEVLQLRNGIYYDDYESLFRQMERRPQNESTLCPGLKHLILRRCPVAPHAVIAMIESRHDHIPLVSVTSAAEEWDQWPPETLEYLSTLVQVKRWIPTHISDPWFS